MPHNHLDVDELEDRYPSLEVVDDVDIPDMTRLEDDSLYAAGMKVVQDILREMSEVVRIRSCVSTQNNVDRRCVSQSKQGAKGGKISDKTGSACQNRVSEERDRSGFGQGGDRSGRAAAASDFQACAVYEHSCVCDRHEGSISARSCRGRAQEPLSLSVTVLTVPESY